MSEEKDKVDKSKGKQLSRREFLKDAGLVAGGAAVGSMAILSACGEATTKTITQTQTATQTVTQTASVTITKPPETSTLPPLTTTITSPQTTITAQPTQLSAPKFTISYNPDVCCGCGACELFCAATHGGSSGRSLARLTMIRPIPDLDFSVKTCKQCIAPSCMAVCLPGAISVDTKTGARVIDEAKCIGCGLCAIACPFNQDAAGQPNNTVIKVNTATKKYFKCDLCTNRVEGPACVEACPFGALTRKDTV